MASAAAALKVIVIGWLLWSTVSGDVQQMNAMSHPAVDANHYLLVNRGFHWINKRPFNR
jgi:hypothetical protein